MSGLLPPTNGKYINFFFYKKGKNNISLKVLVYIHQISPIWNIPTFDLMTTSNQSWYNHVSTSKRYLMVALLPVT
jgi:hypothetical protein